MVYLQTTKPIIKTGGKQYIVSPDQKIRIEKLDKKEGADILFNEVLLLEKNKKIEIGSPFLKGVKVAGKILKQGKNKKVVIFKFKHSNRYHVKKGHRQPFTEVEITDIKTEEK